ncbi:hypothetical protein Q73A0000_08105 [Kaistella flava (ex Peng et al. 2021)]|uniref:Uncharacterized protein n=1 Tax=Kaistella flava (ex Peng et al. 2021) TaxID=2038776 RepID=A0A7M2Y8A4_9FLAO|nr:hypothetical protein [Kaistella flava (ex Peng et al. 2021)]QOW10330.1 hypothetical protein Q73A0000_08105 [Kaistella flava (ex Peng et al. 2021)]
MKNIFKILLGTGLAIALNSCGTVQDPYGNNRPGNVVIYRSNDGVVYRRGEIYRDRNGNVYQNGRIIRSGDIYGRPGIIPGNRNSTAYYPNQYRADQFKNNNRNDRWKNDDHHDRMNRNHNKDKNDKYRGHND